MPSPFPGMDPWLEDPAIFPDLHATLTTYLREALNAVLPPGYVATTKRIVWTEKAQKREPDVSLLADRPGGGPAAVLSAAGLHPLGRRPDPLERTQPRLEITRPGDRRLVTAIELLSPSNKALGDAGRKAYRKKQRELEAARVNVVEFDFLRGGTHTTAVPRPRLEELAGGDFPYHVCVTLAKGRRYFGNVFPLRRPLPEVGVPLDPGVPPVTIALQPLLDRAYDAGRYADLVDYAQPCTPPLSPADLAWANDILSKRTPTPAES